jgi:hypothetical protein
MVNNNLATPSMQTIKKVTSYINRGRPSPAETNNILAEIEEAKRVLNEDVSERTEAHVTELRNQVNDQVEKKLELFDSNPKIARLTKQRDASQNRLEELRAVNNGEFPKNISPVLYVIPLILLGVGEWYVNYSTFSASFVPAIAIAATLITAVVFATASHIHGSYVKQLGEILHPSVSYRQFIDKKLILLLVTVILVIFFSIILWLRYDILREQLGLDTVDTNVFGDSGRSRATAKLLQTAGINAGIWALGTVYAWQMAAKVPALRSVYRDWMSHNHKLESMRSPLQKEQARLEAGLQKSLNSNNVIRQEYEGLLKQLEGLKSRLSA